MMAKKVKVKIKGKYYEVDDSDKEILLILAIIDLSSEIRRLADK